jgi:hypothetical protein
MFGLHDYPLTHALEKIKADYSAQGQRVELVPFIYASDFTLNAAATVAQPNTTDAEGEFHIIKTTQVTFDDAGAFVQFPDITALIFWDVSGRAAQDRPVHILHHFGTGQRAHTWIRPERIPIKSTWTTTLTNLTAGVNYVVRLAYHGVKALQMANR